MTIRLRAFALVLFVCAPAWSQVRVAPVEASRANVPAVHLGAVSVSALPNAGLTTLAAPSPFSAPTAAPSAQAFSLAAPLAVPSRLEPIGPVAAPRLRSAAVLVSAPGPSASPDSQPAVPTAAPGLRSAGAAARSLSAPALDPDALFDGRASRGLLAAADGPTPGRAGLPPRLGRSDRLKRFVRAAGVGVPAAVLVGAAGWLAPHAALAAVHGLGQAAYWLANPFAFLFTMPQVHKMLSRRSADISTGMIGIGLGAAALATLNFAFDGKTLMMARNLAQALGFGVMLGLYRLYTRRRGLTPPSKTRAIVETLAFAAAVTGLLFLAGPGLLAAVEGAAWMGKLLVASQIVSGFGFTYIMFAQLSKMRREHSAGDSSKMMMWAFLGTKTIWVWSLATMIGLATAPAWLTLPVSAAFIAVCWLVGRAALSRLLVEPWNFLPARLGLAGRELSHQRLGDIASFVALSAVILLLSGAGYLTFVDLLRVPAAGASRFAMYLLYTVQSLLACLATMKSLRLQSRYAKPN